LVFLLSNSATLKADVTSTITDANELILRVSTFGPSDYPAFIHSVENAIAAHKSVNGTKLIIDFRANGGGDICLGYAFLRFLFPSLTQTSGVSHSSLLCLFTFNFTFVVLVRLDCSTIGRSL
jgi:hypothetical protein